METTDPEKAEQIFQALVKKPEDCKSSQRCWKSFTGSVQTWKRSRILERSQKYIQCDEGEFKMHWKGRGKKKKTIKHLWKKHTSGSRFRKGLAFTKQKVRKSGKVKKNTIVWVKRQKELADRDVLGSEVKTDQGDNPESMKQLLGEKPLEISKSAKSALGKGCQ